MVKMSKIYFVKVATLCLFDFAKLQRELLRAAAKKQPLAI
jgi:hypothetical protein